jgi:hypothetical protein
VLIPPPTVKGMFMLVAIWVTRSARVLRFSLVAVMSRKTSSSAPFSLYQSARSIGSPASLRFSNFIPFTVRPSLMSRHGIILFASINSF